MLLKKLNKHCLEPFLHAQEAMTLYGAMNYGSTPIITPLAPTPSWETIRFSALLGWQIEILSGRTVIV